MPPDFEVCVAGRPISAQSHNAERLAAWKRVVRAIALEHWPSERQMFEGEVALRITHYAQYRFVDMDNLAKPIQDALQGICYREDRLVDVAANWRDINGRFRVRHMSLPLARAFSDGREFVHVRLWVAGGERDLG
ncbi:MAG: RusA family crossover junction endodeoxyribonuclease [Rhodospirillales bacterium]|nr:RusA family crossover junction endodeoxyribonuclease [Rhodospirillales bacterium]